MHKSRLAALLVALLCAAGTVSAQKKKPVVKDALAGIPQPFRQSVGAELKSGLTIQNARDIALPVGQYLAVVFVYPESDADKGGTKVLKLYFLPPEGKTVKTKDLLEDYFVNLATFDDEKMVFADINRDGRTELIASSGNGGNCWDCSNVTVYTLLGDELEVLASAPMQIKDIDGNGVMELLVGDTRWEFYDDFSHAGSPGGTLVYTWDKGYYGFAGPDAMRFYQKELDSLKAELPDAVQRIDAGDPYSDEGYLRTVLSMYLVYVYTQQADRGRDELTQMLGQHVASEQMRTRRERILKDFLSGDSAKVLKEPRRGQGLKVDEKRARIQ